MWDHLIWKNDSDVECIEVGRTILSLPSLNPSFASHSSTHAESFFYTKSEGASVAILLYCLSVMYMSVCLSPSMSLTGQDGNILLDYSKNIVSQKTMQLLFKLV